MPRGTYSINTVSSSALSGVSPKKSVSITRSHLFSPALSKSAFGSRTEVFFERGSGSCSKLINATFFVSESVVLAAGANTSMDADSPRRPLRSSSSNCFGILDMRYERIFKYFDVWGLRVGTSW